MIEDAFFLIIRMSITASLIVPGILLVRFLIRKAPKKYSYFLWLAIAFRLVCPFGVQSSFSPLAILNLFEAAEETIPYQNSDTARDTQASDLPAMNPIIPADASNISQSSSVQKNEQDTLSKTGKAVEMRALLTPSLIRLSACIWLFGTAAMLSYGGYAYYRTKRSVRNAVCIRPGIYATDHPAAPFVSGIIKPTIFVPFGLNGNDLLFVTLHEKSHINRGDHIVRLISFFILSVHWFNPVIWLVYYICGIDMELSCDEKVLEKLNGGKNMKKAYSMTLLSLAGRHNSPSPALVAFGESSIKKRIKNALSYKKSGKIKSVVTCLICILVLTACSTDPEKTVIDTTDRSTEIAGTNNSIQTLPQVLSSDSDNLSETQPPATTEATDFSDVSNISDGMTETVYSDETEGIKVACPVLNAEISVSYGIRINPLTKEEVLHNGVDFVAETGTDVMASLEGDVVYTGFDEEKGNHIILSHNDSLVRTIYCNLDEIYVSEGLHVFEGEVIGTVGNTGRSTGPHLHFSVMEKGEYVEPEFK